ncbi:MAG: GAF domain-containing protein [Niastella sp.]|nr:GAF domain-containing protein [Niastella sp.]
MTNQLEPAFATDVENIQQLDIVPSILELICRTTGMGFSAVARVTEQRWIACAVRDELNFGLVPGGELQIETTICNEIRGHGQPVVIDEVRTDAIFCNHHTPKLYGFESYISIPIFLKNGQFFGTLCAIDPKPLPLKAMKMVTMFNLFADLIAYHLQSRDVALQQKELLTKTQLQLSSSLDDIRQFSYISQHTLQEPLRKLRVFSDLLAHENTLPADHKARGIAQKINGLATDFSNMIYGLTDFSGDVNSAVAFEIVDTNWIMAEAASKLRLLMKEKHAELQMEPLHQVQGNRGQITRLFYNLLNNALRFSRPGIPPLVRVYSRELTADEVIRLPITVNNVSYCKICFEDNGLGIAAVHREKIFDLFVRLHTKDDYPGLGVGLSQAKRIMRHHGGTIVVDSEPGVGSVFSLVFPLEK